MNNMEREQYTRIDAVRAVVDGIINGIEDAEDRRCAYVHLYGVGLMAALIALKRGYDRKTAELAETAGILHDLYVYAGGSGDTGGHAHACAEYAKEKVLDPSGVFSEEEKTLIYNGIYNHSDKHLEGFWFDEIIKDADAAQHALRNPAEDYFYMTERFRRLLSEIIT